MRTTPKSYLAKYSCKNDVEKQANQVLSIYSGLNVTCEKFYYADGNSKDLICLKGTIPIKFKGATYNIPIAMHLPEVFPNNPPIVYVTPTSTMAVKPSQIVDTNGLVRMPFLAQWKSRTHSLPQLIHLMVQEFGKSPPVFSKPPAGAQRPQAQPQYPGYPPTHYGQQPNPYGGANGYGQQTTPYPVGGMDPTRPPHQQPPAYPPPYNPASGANAANLPYPNMTPPSYSYAPTGQPQQQPPMSQHQPPVSNASMASQNSYGSSAGGVQQMDPIKASLLTAITESLSRRIQSAQEMAQRDLDALTSVGVQLKSNRNHLESTVGQLEQQIAVANSHVDLLQQKKTELETALQQVQMKSEVADIDDCITPSCPLYKQLLNLYAEECAIEDTTYYLDKALMDSVVDLETYLKNVRALSRKQFMVRAQMQKARQVAGLRNITPH